MRVQFLGQAGLFIETQDAKLLCDPWFSETGGFLARWHQFPPNDHLDLNHLRKADYLYVSHMHQDHFDRDFLKTVPKTIQIIAPKFPTHDQLDAYDDLGFHNIIVLKHMESISLGNIKLTMMIEPTGYKEDSCFFLESEGCTILNRNDCHLPDSLLAEFGERNIDLFFTQFSGAMWYPAAYHYEKEKKKELADKVRGVLAERFRHQVELVRPKYVIPNAGPPCFLDDDDFFEQNFVENGTIFPDQHDIVPLLESMSTRYQIMCPGDIAFVDHYEDENYGISFRVNNSYDFENKRQLLEEYRNRRRKVIKHYLDGIREPTNDLFDDFVNHMKKLMASSEYITDKIGIVVHFSIIGKGGGLWQVDFPNRTITNVNKVAQYMIKTESKYLNLILNGHLSWEELFLSLRASAWRNPDAYNMYLFLLLRHGSSPNLMRAIEKNDRETSADLTFIQVQDGKRIFEIQARCPHMGENLSKAKVECGILTCPRHLWQFELNSGKCIFGGDRGIISKQVLNDELAGAA